jgi:hypothetical protein
MSRDGLSSPPWRMALAIEPASAVPLLPRCVASPLRHCDLVGELAPPHRLIDYQRGECDSVASP